VTQDTKHANELLQPSGLCCVLMYSVFVAATQPFGGLLVAAGVRKRWYHRAQIAWDGGEKSKLHTRGLLRLITVLGGDALTFFTPLRCGSAAADPG
jgi:hypothetical protein